MKKLRSTTARPKEEAHTVNALARISGIDRRTISKRLATIKPAGGTKASPTWTVQQLEVATTAAVASTKGESSELKRQKLAEEVRKLRQHNDETARILVEKSGVIAAIQRAGARWNTTRLRMEAEEPAKLVGIVSVPEMAGQVKRIMNEVTAVLNGLAVEFDGL